MAELSLIGGRVALVDDDVLEQLVAFPWRVDSCGYVIATIGGKLTLMHRLIMGAIDGQIVDHQNHNTLDNRRQNLRICTHAENMRNRKVSKNNKLGIKGVRYDGIRNRYRAELKVDGHRFNLGSFRTAEDARVAYVTAAKKHHGEFANFG